MIICTKYQNNIEIGYIRYLDNRNSYIDISPIYHTDAEDINETHISTNTRGIYERIRRVG